MKIVRPMVFRSVAGEDMLIPTGSSVKDFNGIFTLTPTGALIWQSIESGLDEGQIAARLCEAYEVSAQQAERDVCEFIDRLCAMGIVEREQEDGE